MHQSLESAVRTEERKKEREGRAREFVGTVVSWYGILVSGDRHHSGMSLRFYTVSSTTTAHQYRVSDRISYDMYWSSLQFWKKLSHVRRKCN